MSNDQLVLCNYNTQGIKNEGKIFYCPGTEAMGAFPKKIGISQ